MPIIFSDDTQLNSAKSISFCTNEPCISLFDWIKEPYSESLKEITYITHTVINNNDLIGKYNSKRLAAIFSQGFKNRDKKELEHVYLIACAAGLNIANQPCLAHLFAIKMQEQGFTNVKIHAVTNPFDLSIVELSVGVAISDGNLAWELKGDIRGIAYENKFTQNIEHELDDLREAYYSQPDDQNIHKKLKALENKKKNPEYKSTIFFLALNGSYKQELVKPYHTYTPSGVEQKYSYCVAIANIFLNKRKIILNLHPTTSRKKYLILIDEILTQINLNPDMDQNKLIALIQTKKNNFKTFNYILSQLIEELGSLNRIKFSFFETINKKIYEPIDQKYLIAELNNYIEIRQKEWDYHYNFLGILAFIYYLYDAITHTDHFKSIQKQTKISAATKLLQHLEGRNVEELTPTEKKAFADKRLGKIVEQYGGVMRVWCVTYLEDKYHHPECNEGSQIQ